MKQKQIRIKQDVFGVANRLTQINKNFEIYFNVQTQRYEVYERRGFATFFAFSIKHKQLDARAICDVWNTQKQLLQAALQEIEQHNMRLQQKQQDALQKQNHYKLKQIVDYASAGSKDFEFDNSFQTKWV